MPNADGSTGGSAVIDSGLEAPDQPTGMDEPTTAPSRPEITERRRRRKKGKSERAEAKSDAKPRKSYANGRQRTLSPREMKTMAAVYAASIVVHVIVLAILGYLQFEDQIQEALRSITASISEKIEEDSVEVVETPDPVELGEDAPKDESEASQDPEPEEPVVAPPKPDPPSTPPPEPKPERPEPVRVADRREEISGRSPRAREALRDQYGGSGETDAAVFSGLAWLQKQQRKDGSWSFDHVTTDGAKAGSNANSPTAATGMVLLAYLGAGQTHLEGKYRKTVYDGLLFLMKHAEENLDRNRADMRSGSGRMYSHCMATLALCEAHALTEGKLRRGLPGAPRRPENAAERIAIENQLKQFRAFEKKLKVAAQVAVNFLVLAQCKDGGWRYTPNDPAGGDMSVSGWAVMAIHSARVAELTVPSDSFRSANQFLTRMSRENGTRYWYASNASHQPAMTAVGSLCRIYLDATNDGLPGSVRIVSQAGPSLNNMYVNYYATQVMHHWGGDLWNEWNLENRDRLVAAQRRDGPSAGSWPFTTGYHGADQGGDILQTCFCVMTLEVYYRHLPIYQRRSERTDR